MPDAPKLKVPRAAEAVSAQMKDDVAVVAGPADTPETAEAEARQQAETTETGSGSQRKGWWQRTFGE